MDQATGPQLWSLPLEVLDRIFWLVVGTRGGTDLFLSGDSLIRSRMERSHLHQIDLKDDRLNSTSRFPSHVLSFRHLRHLSVNRGCYVLTDAWKLAEILRQLPRELLSLKIVSLEADLTVWSQRPPTNAVGTYQPAKPWNELFPALETLYLRNGPAWDDQELSRLPPTLQSLTLVRQVPTSHVGSRRCIVSDALLLPRGLTFLQLGEGQIEKGNFSNLPPNLTTLIGISDLVFDVHPREMTEADACKAWRQLPRTMKKTPFFVQDYNLAISAAIPPALEVMRVLDFTREWKSMAPFPKGLTQLAALSTVFDHSALSCLPPTLKVLECSKILWKDLAEVHRTEISDMKAMIQAFDIRAHPHLAHAPNAKFWELTTLISAKKMSCFPPSLETLDLQYEFAPVAPYLLPSSLTSFISFRNFGDDIWDAKLGLLLPNLKNVHLNFSPADACLGYDSLLQALEGSFHLDSFYTYAPVPVDLGMAVRFPRNLGQLRVDPCCIKASELQNLPPQLKELSLNRIIMDQGFDDADCGIDTLLKNLPRSLTALSVSSLAEPNAPLPAPGTYTEWEYEPFFFKAESFRFMPPHLTDFRFYAQRIPAAALKYLQHLPLTNLSILLDTLTRGELSLLPRSLTRLDMDASSSKVTLEDMVFLPPHVAIGSNPMSHFSQLGRAYSKKLSEMKQETPDPRVLERLYSSP